MPPLATTARAANCAEPAKMKAEAATAWSAEKPACRATTPKDIESTKPTTAYGMPSRTPRTNDSLTRRRLGDGYDASLRGTGERWTR